MRYVTGKVQGRVSSLTEQERVSREQCIMLRSTVSALESRLAAATREAAEYKTNLELQQAQCNQLKQAKDKYAYTKGYEVCLSVIIKVLKLQTSMFSKSFRVYHFIISRSLKLRTRR
jgi:hypothetical protein